MVPINSLKVGDFFNYWAIKYEVISVNINNQPRFVKTKVHIDSIEGIKYHWYYDMDLKVE